MWCPGSVDSSPEVGEGGVLDGLDGKVVRDGGKGSGGRRELLDLHTDLLGQNHRGLLTLGGTQHGGALLQLLALLLGVGQLEALLLLTLQH